MWFACWRMWRIPRRWQYSWKRNYRGKLKITKVLVFQIKCDQYWPEIGPKERYGTVKVTNLGHEVFSDYVITTLRISCQKWKRRVSYNEKIYLLRLMKFSIRYSGVSNCNYAPGNSSAIHKMAASRSANAFPIPGNIFKKDGRAYDRKRTCGRSLQNWFRQDRHYHTMWYLLAPGCCGKSK